MNQMQKYFNWFVANIGTITDSHFKSFFVKFVGHLTECTLDSEVILELCLIWNHPKGRYYRIDFTKWIWKLLEFEYLADFKTRFYLLLSFG